MVLLKNRILVKVERIINCFYNYTLLAKESTFGLTFLDKLKLTEVSLMQLLE